MHPPEPVMIRRRGSPLVPLPGRRAVTDLDTPTENAGLRVVERIKEVPVDRVIEKRVNRFVEIPREKLIEKPTFIEDRKSVV